MKPHVIVISLDGLASTDVSILKDLPNFSALLSSGTSISEIEGVYPTQTYPLHTSLITGSYPHRHGIVSNARFQPGVEEPDWHWFARDIKCPTLFDVARESGLRVATILWPVAARSRVDYNLPEIKAAKGKSQLWTIISNGTPLFVANMGVRYGKQLRGLETSPLDDFVTSCAVHTILRKRPDLLLIHWLDLDQTRHKYGFQSDEALQVIVDEDKRLGRILEACGRSGISDDTTIFLLGDHAYLDVHSRININSALREEGFIKTGKDNAMEDWQAWSRSCDGSAQIVLNRRDDPSTLDRIRRFLEDLKSQSNVGIESVFGRQEVSEQWKLGDGIDFVLEAKQGYCFTNATVGPVVLPANPEHLAAHGYRPDRPGYRSFMVAVGRGIPRGGSCAEARIIDIGPTIGKVLGLELPGAEGRVISGLFDGEKVV